MAEEDGVPEEQRCKRTDGRKWRCKRPVQEGKLLCEVHSAQARLRNGKLTVPHSLKLHRSNRTNNNPPTTTTTTTIREHLHRKTKTKPLLDEALNPLALHADESADKQKNKKKKKNYCCEEITKELPFGRMAIAPFANPTSPPPLKLGLHSPNYPLTNRKFRSKNVQQPPLTTLKAVPYARNQRNKTRITGVQRGIRKCHWCHKAHNVSLNKCLACKNRFFCSDCIKERSIEAQEVKLKCPVCHGTCDCHACLVSHPKDANSEDKLRKECRSVKHFSFCYIINLVLPILEQINEEQRIELEMSARLKEQSLSEVEIQRAQIGEKNQICCNKCGSFILDMHRSCPRCSYNLCLSCCQESRDLLVQLTPCLTGRKSMSGGNVHTGKEVAKRKMQNLSSLDSDSAAPVSNSSVYSGNLFCPSLEFGGCNSKSSILDLTCIFPLNYTRELEISAKEMILNDESPKILDPSLHCSYCSAMAREGNKKELLEASRRNHPGDNFLYCPSIHDDYDILFVHFQKHWGNCHPVIIRNLLEKASGLTWDPLGMLSSYLKMELSRCENDEERSCVTNCKDWYKAEFHNKQSYNGSLSKSVHSSNETLKLKARLSSVMCQRVFSAQYAEILNCLPLQEYTNPNSGLLNLAANLAEDSQGSEFHPHIHIACCNSEDVEKGELVNAIFYHSHDLVNILVHASDLSSSSTDQVSKIKMLVRMKSRKDMGGSNGLDLDNRITKECDKITEEAENPLVGKLSNSRAKAPASETESDTSVMCSGTNRDNPKPSTSEESGEERPCGIQWDVFRKQDAPKLLEYIQRHSNEFYDPRGSLKQAVDPILDGIIFLDSAHKLKLKHEFKIEPWTFNQKLGEAVLIPAGCPYQMKNLKSTVNVVLGFVSPENAGECIRLADKHQDLPTVNKSKVEVQKMVINKISKAIEEMRNDPI